MGKRLIIIISLLFIVILGYFIFKIFEKEYCILPLSETELEIYNNFAVERSDAVLSDPSPLLICKLYLHSVLVNDTDTSYALLSKDECNTFVPSKDEFLIECFLNYGTIEDKAYYNCENVRVTLQEDGLRATVSWVNQTTKGSKSNSDNSIFEFNLIKDNSGIWKVAYPPFE